MHQPLVLGLALAVSGCCCPLPPRSDDGDWTQSVQRERENPQTAALEPGTVSVFVIEVSAPGGRTQADQDRLTEHEVALEAARLDVALSERRRELGIVMRGDAEVRGLPKEEVEAAWAPVLKAQRDALAALEAAPLPVPRGAVEVRERVHFTVLHPHLRGLEDFGDVVNASREVAGRGGILLRSHGFLPVRPGEYTREQFEAGVPLTGSVSVGSVSEASTVPVQVPADGRAVLRLESRCPARVVRVEGDIKVGETPGIAAIPKYEERTWWELRDAPCAGSGSTVREAPGGPPPEVRPWQASQYHRVQLNQVLLERLR